MGYRLSRGSKRRAGGSSVNALYLRLTVALAGLLGALAVGLIVLQGRTSDRYADEVLQRLNANVAMYVVRELSLLDGETVNRASLDELGRRAMTVNPSTEVYLLSPTGRMLSTLVPGERIQRRSVNLKPIKLFLGNATSRPLYGDDPTSSSARRVFSVAPIERNGRLQGYLYVVLGGARTQSIAAQLRDSYSLRMATMALLLVFAATLLVAGLLFAALTRRLRGLDESMRVWTATLPDQVLGTSASVLSGDEISILVKRFELMAGAIERQIHELQATDALRRELIANVSHDLRTPLTTLRGYIETLQLRHSASAPVEWRTHLDVALRQTDQLGRMIDALFELAKLESGTVTAKLESFAVAEWLHDVAQRFQIRAREQGIELFAARDLQGASACADIELMERVIGNLIENALRYTPRGGHVRMEANADRDLVRVRVVDSGQGIDPAHLPRLFERFYSAPDHSDRNRTGLGLAIVKRIVDLHGQHVTIHSQRGGGTTVEFTLARAA